MGSTFNSEVVTTKTNAPPSLPPVPANAKRIFWVRHGEVINPGGPGRNVYYGAMDIPLSPLGELEAQAAAEYMQQFPVALVVSSPLQRAIYGAEQVLKLQQQQQQKAAAASTTATKQESVIQLAGFTELERGAWRGLTKEEIGAENLARFDACDESITPQGGESYPQLKARVLKARDEVLSLLQDGEIGCVVSHLQVTRSILSEALNIPTSEMANIKVATASITCLDYYTDSGEKTVHFQSFKPEAGLKEALDGAN